MKKLIPTLLSSLMFAATFAGTPSTKKATLLRLDLEKGATHSLVTEMTMTYFTNANMQEEIGKMENTVVFDIKVMDKTADGIHTIEAILKSVKAKQAMQGMEVYYDSEDPETAQGMGAMVAQQFSPILNKPIVFKVNNMGKIVEKPVDSQSGPMSASSLVSNLFIEMPEQAISEGDTWEKTQSSEGMAAMDISVNFKADEITKQQVVLSFSASNEDIELEETEEEQLGDTEIKMGGKMTFDRKTGRLLSNTLSQTLSGSDPQQGEFFAVTSIKQTSK